MVRKLFLTMMVMGILLSMVSPVYAGPAQDGPTPPVRKSRLGDFGMQVEEAPESVVLEKVAPELRELARLGSKEEKFVVIEVQAGVDLSAYLSDYMARPFVFRGNQMVYGNIQAKDLMALAARDDVTAIRLLEMPDPNQAAPDKPFAPDHEIDEAARQARLEAIRTTDIPYAEAPELAVNAEGWWDVKDGHKSMAAWEKGFTGQGVVVGVIDDGIDYGHPDLMGTMARVVDPDSPYYGWPMAYNDMSMLLYFNDAGFGSSYIKNGFSGVWYVDASEMREVVSGWDGLATIKYAPLVAYATWGMEHEYTIPATSQSGWARVGSFPDRDLEALYGERVAVLVMDERAAGVYDTVYVDLDNDYDFTDEKPARWGDEHIYRDMDGDGYTDISGGALQWISDGENHPPVYDWLWGGLGAVPASGELLMFTGAYDAGYSHGTNCASNIAGQGVVAGGLSAPSFLPEDMGMVHGAAPDVGLMDFGDQYWSLVDTASLYTVAALGYDGIPYSGDEVQITTNSYGAFGQYFGNWSYYDRYIADLNTSIGGQTTYVFSYGNDGPGYGTHEGEDGVTALKVSSSSQYGSTNWDSIASADQIVYGDVTGFASNGPDFDGNLAPDVLANGGRGAGSEKINYYGFDGWDSWATWGGTSRSAPVAGGNLALVYQAYKDRTGQWPSFYEAKALLMGGANDAATDPSFQGAGVVNADRATDLAGGIYGVLPEPAKWNVGDYRGLDYMSFAHMVSPGDVATKTFTLYNESGYDVTVDLSDGKMKQLGDAVEIPFTSSDLSEESGFNFHSPDYLIPIDTSIIPTDTDLMVVRFVQPLDQYDPDGDQSTENHWRHLIYNWTDLNGDGKLWTDANKNGTVNHMDNVAAGPDNDGFYQVDYANSEIQQGEYVRLDYNFAGNTDQLTIRDPLGRMADGLFLGLQHRRSTEDLPVSGLTIYLEFYERADWPWLALSDTSVTVPAEDMATFDAVMTVPSDAPYGFYDGHILVADPGDANHDAHTTMIPVGVDVAAELSDEGVTYGGGDPTGQLYDNNVVRGLGQWDGGGWSIYGDWRHFYMDVPADEIGTYSYLVAHSDWDGAAPTEAWPLANDVDTYILGPYDDGFYGAPEFGPYGMQVLGTSRMFNAGGGLWPFTTWTGDTEDWAATKLDREGLYEFGLHNGLFDGESAEAGVSLDVGRVDVQATVSPSGTAWLGPWTDGIEADVYTQTGQVDVWFESTIDLPNLNAKLSGGLVDTTYGPFNVWVPDTGACYSAWCTGNVYEPFMVPPDQVKLEVYVYSYGHDPDLFLVYDANDNGVAEEGIDPVIASDGGGSGGNGDELVVINSPTPGRYFAVIDGYNTGGGDWLDWKYTLTGIQTLPTYSEWFFGEMITGTADAPFDPLDAGYSMDVTMPDNAAALYVDLSEVTPEADFDLYVIDENDEIVASSKTKGTSYETIMLEPEGNYRFEPGTVYTILVHGQDLWNGTMLMPEAHAWLDVGWDLLKLWLEKPAVHPDVHPSEIGAGDMVSVTVNYEDPSMQIGYDCLQGYLTVGPDDFELLYEKVSACYVPSAPQPGFEPVVWKDAESERGPSPWLAGDWETELAAPGDTLTHTITLENWGELSGTVLVHDYWGAPVFMFQGFVGDAPDNFTYQEEVSYPDAWGGVYGPYGTFYFTQTLEPFETVVYTYTLMLTDYADVGWAFFNEVDIYDNAGYYAGWTPEDYWYWGYWPWDWDLTYTYYGSANISVMKEADAYYVLPGDTVNYTIHIMNEGAEDDDVFVSDPLDADLVFVSATNGATYDADTHTVIWGDRVRGTTLSEETFEIEATVADTAMAGATIPNDVYYGTKVDDVSNMVMGPHLSVMPSAGLSVDKSVDQVNVYGGGMLEYTIVLSNDGPDAAMDATLMDVIPDYLTLITDTLMVDMGGGETAYLPLDTVWDASTNTLEWMTDIAVGETYTVTFQVEVNEGASEEWAFINLAELEAGNSYTAYNSAVTEVFEYDVLYLPLVVRGE